MFVNETSSSQFKDKQNPSAGLMNEAIAHIRVMKDMLNYDHLYFFVTDDGLVFASASCHVLMMCTACALLEALDIFLSS